MYDNRTELLQEIAAGEDSFLELKEVVFKGNQVRFGGESGKASSDIAEVLASFANTQGGVIVFGVTKDRAIVGVEEPKRDLLEQFVVNMGRDNCVPPVEPLTNWVQLPDADDTPRLCLKVTIEKSRFYVHQTTDGRFLKRVGSHRALIPAEQLGRLLSARDLAVPFEERPTPRVPFSAIDEQRFDTYHRTRFGVSHHEREIAPSTLLGNLKLAAKQEQGDWTPTNLGVLLFAERPSRWIPGAYIDIAAYTHGVADGDIADSRQVHGPIPEQIEQVLQYFGSSPLIAIPSTRDGWGRQDRPAYALTALQEATVNALIHRDYGISGSQVRILLLPDRIEFWNPGGLHNTLTPEDLFAGCQPVRRNQLLAGFMRDYVSPVTDRSYMESRGEGFLRLVKESRELSGKRPDLKQPGQAVCLTIYGAT